MKAIALLLGAVLLAGAVPNHVQTADYYAGYAGTKVVAPASAARWLTWAETDVAGARSLEPYGVKAILYTNPYRIIPTEPMYTDDESTFAHDCGGKRIETVGGHANQYLMDPGSAKMRELWRNYVAEHVKEARFAAVFADDAAGDVYVSGHPCNYDTKSWLDAVNGLQRAIGFPVIYNALADYQGHGISKEIALNSSAMGGMLEECYSQLQPDTRATGWRWWADERTELAMAAAHKYFFCYGRDLTPADQAIQSRIYTYASFLLTYDPRTSVLWEYYQTPTHAHVMPETQLVAYNPVRRITQVGQLRAPGGLFVREYRDCYLRGRRIGACAAAVNSDDDAHQFTLRGYRRTLVLHGSGVFDGGTADANGPAPPSTVAPGSAVIAFR